MNYLVGIAEDAFDPDALLVELEALESDWSVNKESAFELQKDKEKPFHISFLLRQSSFSL